MLTAHGGITAAADPKSALPVATKAASTAAAPQISFIPYGACCEQREGNGAGGIVRLQLTAARVQRETVLG